MNAHKSETSYLSLTIPICIFKWEVSVLHTQFIITVSLLWIFDIFLRISFRYHSGYKIEKRFWRSIVAFLLAFETYWKGWVKKGGRGWEASQVANCVPHHFPAPALLYSKLLHPRLGLVVSVSSLWRGSNLWFRDTEMNKTGEGIEWSDQLDFFSPWLILFSAIQRLTWCIFRIFPVERLNWLDFACAFFFWLNCVDWTRERDREDYRKSWGRGGYRYNPVSIPPFLHYITTAIKTCT